MGIVLYGTEGWFVHSFIHSFIHGGSGVWCHVRVIFKRSKRVLIAGF